VAAPVPQCTAMVGVMQHQIDDLQARFAHQELAIEALTETVTRQDRLIRELRDQVVQLKQLISELKPSPLGSDAEKEPPPPHY